jgi:hypothetical protein
MRTQLSAPVSLIVILIGAGLIYYVFHSHGWSFGSDVSLGYTYRSLPVPFGFLVIAGFVMSAWGTGSFLNALLLAGKSNEPIPPSS